MKTKAHQFYIYLLTVNGLFILTYFITDYEIAFWTYSLRTDYIKMQPGELQL